MLDLRIAGFIAVLLLPFDLATAWGDDVPGSVSSVEAASVQGTDAANHDPALLAAPVNEQPDSSTLTPAEQEKTVRAYAALMAIVGIAFAGLGLIALTIIGARRLRRVSKTPLPSADLKQELWFLRPTKPPLRGNHDTSGTPPPPAQPGDV